MSNSKLIFVFLLVLIIGKHSSCQNDLPNKSHKTLKLNKLIDSYTNSFKNNRDSSLYYQRIFFYAFPNNFSDLVDVFGYHEDSTGITTGPLFKDSKEYIDLFISINSIPDDEYIDKLIKISINGVWQSDGINYFQDGLIEKVRINRDVFVKLLKKYSDKDIYGFWHFYFDGPHPHKLLPSHIADIKKIDTRIYNILRIASVDVQNKWSRD